MGSAIVVYWLTLPQGTAIAGALAVTIFAAVLWITQALPLPVTALLIPVGFSAVGVFDAKNAFSSFGNPVLFLVLGGYALAVAVEMTSAILSMLISNTATTALLLPVALSIINHQQHDQITGSCLWCEHWWCCNINGITTKCNCSWFIKYKFFRMNCLRSTN